MASAIVKALQKVPAILDDDEEILEISKQVIVNRELQFEIENDDVTKHKDIEMILFEDCFMMNIPDADCLFKIAPNFNYLALRHTNLTRICSDDLRGFEKLERLDLEHNEIEELPSDLFIHTPNLQIISFESNKIKVIGENILQPLKNLEEFDLSDNPGIDACYDSLITGKKDLAQFKEAILRCTPAQNDWKRKFEAQKQEIADLKKLCIDQGAKIERLEKELKEAKKDGAFHKFDFTIKVNGKTFKVQKEILAASSPVLADLIRNNEDADTLELKDISEEVFEEILYFMVKKAQPKPTANFIKIYAASGRLQMKELNDLCARILMDKITKENAWQILGLCEKYPNTELGKKALYEMKKIYEKP